MIYIAICDDDEKTLDDLRQRVEILLREHNVIATIYEYVQSRSLQYDINEGKYFDLILSDIEMPDVDGMNLAAYIKKYLPEALIIFITFYTKYAIDAFELSIFRYVPKSALNSRLPHAVLDAIKLIDSISDRVYYIKTPTRVEKIPYQKILYIEKDGKNSIIKLTDGSSSSVRKSMTVLIKELDSEEFAFIDRGNIVNIEHIMKIKNGSVDLENGIHLQASRTKIEQIKQMVSDYWSKKI